MAAPPQQRNLKELLKEEQEPFHLTPHSHIQNASFPSTFCRNACFCSSSSPDPFKRSSDALFLHVPPKTGALLLQAASRVHNNSKSKHRIRNPGFGLLNSLIKRLRIRTRTRNPETGDEGDVVRWAETSSNSSSFSMCSTTTSGTGNVSHEEVRFVNGFEREKYTGNNGGIIGYEDFPCAIYSIPSPNRRSPAFCSPVISPARPILQERVNYEQNPPVKSLVEEDEEDKEQNSPVSILDPPFEDDDDYEDEEEGQCRWKEDGSDLECSYTFLQRAKRRVLLKLQKFEKLAELDPIKLEGRMVEEEEEDGDEYDDIECEARKDDEFSSTTHEFEINVDGILVDVVSCEPDLTRDLKMPWMKRLVCDMISEEERLDCRSSSRDVNHNQFIVKRVCKRLVSWREVETDTIDMMIGMDFRAENDKWKKQAQDEEISRVATEVEFYIFAGLIEESLNEFL